ncbi:expressed unknown protein [Seminavis robusta]|uniref:Uncharacterized protein n=1 Tax=Seminavis robusta TaxID=568900 RepID=A0A9N8DLS6_9STRA|nr:expressed unknown protein [Seminavis robusta]|eukprot:Sro196_g083450.1 n/a (890) ;mRNA; r:26394-29063
MGATESVFYEEGQPPTGSHRQYSPGPRPGRHPGGRQTNAQAGRRPTQKRARPPTTPVKTLEGVILGLPKVGKRTLLERLKGRDPFDNDELQKPQQSPEQNSTRAIIPYQAPDGFSLMERVQVKVEATQELYQNMENRLDFVIVLVNPKEDPRQVQIHIAKIISDLIQVQKMAIEQQQCDPSTLALRMCFLVNFRDVHNSKKKGGIQEGEIQQLIIALLQQSAEQILNPQQVLIQFGTISLYNCYGLSTLHQFLFDTFMHIKRKELEFQLTLVDEQLAKSREVPRVKYKDFLKMVNQAEDYSEDPQPPPPSYKGPKPPKASRHKPQLQQLAANGVANGAGPMVNLEGAASSTDDSAGRRRNILNVQEQAPPSTIDQVAPTPGNTRDALEAFLASDDEDEPAATKATIKSQTSRDDSDDDDFFYDEEALQDLDKSTQEEETQSPPNTNSRGSYRREQAKPEVIKEEDEDEVSSTGSQASKAEPGIQDEHESEHEETRAVDNENTQAAAVTPDQGRSEETVNGDSEKGATAEPKVEGGDHDSFGDPCEGDDDTKGEPNGGDQVPDGVPGGHGDQPSSRETEEDDDNSAEHDGTAEPPNAQNAEADSIEAKEGGSAEKIPETTATEEPEADTGQARKSDDADEPPNRGEGEADTPKAATTFDEDDDDFFVDDTEVKQSEVDQAASVGSINPLPDNAGNDDEEFFVSEADDGDYAAPVAPKPVAASQNDSDDEEFFIGSDDNQKDQEPKAENDRAPDVEKEAGDEVQSSSQTPKGEVSEEANDVSQAAPPVEDPVEQAAPPVEDKDTGSDIGTETNATAAQGSTLSAAAHAAIVAAQKEAELMLLQSQTVKPSKGEKKEKKKKKEAKKHAKAEKKEKKKEKKAKRVASEVEAND